MFDTVYFDGIYKRKADVSISPDDRGFLFGDGAYEVVVAYRGRYFRKREHLERLNHSLRGLRIGGLDALSLDPILDDLMRKNDVGSGDVTAYIQVTRGSAVRKHAFPPADVRPTVFAQLMPVVRDPSFKTGVSVITVPDTRWSRCDIKSVNLLPNCLANQLAQEAGCIEAIFVRDGVVLEGSLSSFFAVFDGVARTAPKSNYILAGVTRQAVLDICEREGISFSEEPIYLTELQDAEEMFITGTTREVAPIIRLDGQPVGNGQPGPFVRRLAELYRAEAEAATADAKTA
ncbi:MAG: aminotransferase class IV [Gemmatimonadota bacterium]|nr:MAG: aminotransferase class IV [Gemmatimonadota bacterium]